jgi:hypothetical protein
LRFSSTVVPLIWASSLLQYAGTRTVEELKTQALANEGKGGGSRSGDGGGGAAVREGGVLDDARRIAELLLPQILARNTL